MVKKAVKAILKKLYAKNIGRIVVPDDVDVISFDIFDTIVKRKTGDPDSIFRAMEDELRIDGFAKARERAEKEARKKTDRQEISLEDIYSQLTNNTGHNINELQQLEIETEIKMCVPVEKTVSLFNELIEKGKMIILVSDMYLPREVMEEILKRCRISGYSKLYISSEEGVTKKTGDLFDFVLRDLNLKKKLLHIGDNPVGDYLVPKRKKIAAFLIR